MPELPDVEVYRRELESKALNQRIAAVEVKTPRILGRFPAKRLIERLEGRRFTGTRRHGKRLYAALDDGGFLGMHFGMTGALRYFTGEDPEPAFDRVRIDFANGRHLGYYNRRMIGRVALIPDADADVAERRLGPDALDLDLKTFKQRIGRSRGAVKSVLMDQTLIAGIGNIYTDEILFQARVHPKTPAAALDAATLARMHKTMRSVLKKAIQRGADPERLPRHFLIPCREAGEKCPSCGGKIARVALGGRSTYFCPRCQPAIRKG
jgi:formamidopyrimidine-DNA glycosylase